MSTQAKKITWGVALLGMSVGAVIAAIALTGEAWAIGALLGLGLVFAAAAAVVFAWKRVRRLFLFLDRHFYGEPRFTSVSDREMEPSLPQDAGGLTPWRRAEAVLRRYSELSVNFDNPPPGDPGSYRSDEAWDEKFGRFEKALGRLELAAEDAPGPQYAEYLNVCSDIRSVLSASVQKPKGMGYYLALSRSRVMDRLQELVDRDRPAS